MSVSLKDELLSSGNVMFTNKGVSMRPFLREGKDLMIIHKRNTDTVLNIGDAVLFERPSGALVLHRIKEKKDEGYLILGDNCLEPEYVRDEQIIGLLTGIVRNGKKKTDVNDPFYKRLVRLWGASYPVRKVIMRAKRKLNLSPSL